MIRFVNVINDIDNFIQLEIILFNLTFEFKVPDGARVLLNNLEWCILKMEEEEKQRKQEKHSQLNVRFGND